MPGGGASWSGAGLAASFAAKAASCCCCLATRVLLAGDSIGSAPVTAAAAILDAAFCSFRVFCSAAAAALRLRLPALERAGAGSVAGMAAPCEGSEHAW